MSIKANINPENLKEARRRINMPLDVAARKIKISNPQKLLDAENGDHQITFNQLQDAAKVYNIPFGYFYLNQLPVIGNKITDFRMNPDYFGLPRSPELIKTINTAIACRNDIFDIYQKLDYELPEFNISCTLDDDIEIVGQEIRDLFNDRCFSSKQKIINRVIEQLENAGIYVFRTGGEAYNKVSYEEFDGACVYFEKLPIIILNSIDFDKNKKRIIFTIFHELTHLLLHNSAITNYYFKNSELPHSKIETFCNKVAAAALVPKVELIDHYSNGNSISEIADHFRVSRYVVTIRLRNQNLISQTECDELLKQYDYEYSLYSNKNNNKEIRFNPNTIKKRNLGNMYVNSIKEALSNNLINYHDALNSLGMKDKAARKVLYGK